MALALKDRIKETTTTTGTGTVTLAGAAAGFQSFAAVGDGNQTFYAIVDSASGDWEVGVGTYTASGTTLSRTTVVSSSNAGSLVNFAAGSKDVFVTYPSSRSVYLDAAGSAVTTLDIGTLGTSTANITTANITGGTVATTPLAATDLANKQYVDTLVSSGLTYHAAVKYEVPNTTGNLNATYNQPGGPGVGVGATLTNNGTKAAFAPDGPTASVGDRVIVYNQTNAFENGVYTVTTVGTPDPGGTNWVLTRATDADTYGVKSPNSLGLGDAFFVTSGNTGAGETYECNTVGTITFGTTAITFVQISSAQVYNAGTGLTLSPATTFNIASTGVAANTYGSASAVPVFAVNAQGQLTSVTNTNIAITGAAVSGNISGQSGSVANALTAGTYLTSTGTFDGSAARTFAVDATSTNTADKVVARDASGNFSAGTITATLSGSATSATTATNLAGGAANQIAYQSGAGATTFTVAPTASNQVLNWNGSAFTWSAGTISGVALGSNLNTLTFGTYLTGTSYNGSGAVTLATNATSANTASTLVARDASGNFTAGTITAALSGNATTSSSTSGNAATATALQTARTINGVSFNGTANITVADATKLPLAGGTLTGNLLFANATSPFSNYIQFGDNSGWNFRFMTSVAGTPTTRFTFGDNGNFTAVGSVTGTNITAAGNVTGSSASCTGNAATATNLSTNRTNWSTNGTLSAVVGQLAWKNYANNHTIFDASASTSPDGGAVNNTNAAVAWSATYPTLMGWNGSSTYGVRVDSARVADSATTATTANALNSANTYSVTRLTATPNTSGVSTGITAANGDMTAYRSGGTTGVIYLSSSGSNYLYWDGGTYYLNGGSLSVTSNITAYASDARLKKNVKNIPNALEQVKKIRGVTYDWDLEECNKWDFTPPESDVGVIAQEVQAVQPHAVKFAPFDRDPMDNGVSKSGKDYLTVQYEKLVPLLIEAIKELEAKVAALEAKG